MNFNCKLFSKANSKGYYSKTANLNKKIPYILNHLKRKAVKKAGRKPFKCPEGRLNL